MHWQSIVLLVVVALGGVAVIGSYVIGLRGQAGASATLWGGVPAKLRTALGVSMLLSAVGFLALLYYICFVLDPDEVTIAGGAGFYLFYPIFVLILAPSALWMPWTKLYVRRGGGGLWACIRTVLFIVGLASIALAWALFSLDDVDHGVAFWFAAVGSCVFALHTFVFDAVLWARLFRRGQG